MESYFVDKFSFKEAGFGIRFEISFGSSNKEENNVNKHQKRKNFDGWAEWGHEILRDYPIPMVKFNVYEKTMEFASRIRIRYFNCMVSFGWIDLIKYVI
jgi:hypothetical protein